ncbi:S46 family peptidase [uncultured Sunxiuqinia sp.]|uniref:S46 family peptidase n=1 Tax=uncultured Sunxiuqinia sp. TaxID=1573825 RepID=UPI00261AD2FD|nr:S46 family peptidase [uncultured Sunxiuqinia sp.]
MKKIILFVFVSMLCFSSMAKEGMWVPTLLEKYTIEEMQQMGFRLSAEDVYSVNQNSLKDAVVIFGRGCTGEMISDKGLLLTNHHCGYSAIQSHSSVEQDYLSNGFWAMSQEEELPNPGLTAKFLDRMEDVSDSVFAGTEELEGDSLQAKLDDNIRRIQQQASEEGKYEAIVKPLYFGNQYFLYVYQVFTDVRLVGAPPSAIGKFGGDTDNWMWPRHTGDFSIFRVYANANNEPAPYSEDNVPYKPKNWLPISMNGVQPDDFMMLMGYPGTTQQYLPSQAVDMIINQSNPDRIKIRTAILDIFSKHMEQDPKVRIQYASKYASTSNSWKRWKGEIRGLNRLNAIMQKEAYEADFEVWYMQNDTLEEAYASVLPQFDQLYINLQPYEKANNYYQEIVFKGIDIFKLAESFPRNDKGWNRLDGEKHELVRKALDQKLTDYFDDYDPATDQELFTELLRLLRNDLDQSFLPKEFTDLLAKYNDEKLIRKVYQKSVLADASKLKGIVAEFDSKAIDKLQKDPVLKLYNALRQHYQQNIERVYQDIKSNIARVQKQYMKGIMAMEKSAQLYPDANFTMRVAYGKVEGYQPRDGVEYSHQTTLQGIMEKYQLGNPDYKEVEKLKTLYQTADFGEYGEDGQMPVAYTASIHSTGGNSGSPAINAKGQLVGLNFDRCWEGTMSDIMFDPDQCRNIMVDIRYVLFIVDKFAGAGYLLDEMDLIRE